jgi:hypothetical protein
VVYELSTRTDLTAVLTKLTLHHNRGIALDASTRTQLHVEPDKEADASPSPFFSAFSGLPFSSGFVADALNDCSKSAMMSSICSVPTEMRIKSYDQLTPIHLNEG